MASIHTDQNWWVNSFQVVRYKRTKVDGDLVRNPRVRYDIITSDNERFTVTVRQGIVEDNLRRKLGEDIG